MNFQKKFDPIPTDHVVQNLFFFVFKINLFLIFLSTLPCQCFGVFVPLSDRNVVDGDCDNVVKVVESMENFGNYVAHVSFLAPNSTTPDNKSRSILRMTMDAPFTTLESTEANVSMTNGVEGRAEFDIKVESGQEITFPFRIVYAAREPVPKCSQLILENHLICTSPTIRETTIINDEKESRLTSVNISDERLIDTIPLWLIVTLVIFWASTVIFYILFLCRQGGPDCLARRKPIESDQVVFFNPRG